MSPDSATADPLAPPPDHHLDELPDDEALGLDTERPARRWILAAGGLVLVLLIGGGVAITRLTGDEDGGDPAAAAATGLTTAAVERRTLEERAELDGTLGYGDVTDLALAAQGTITGLAPIGSVVGRGQTLIEIDGRQVPLLLGNRPLWRQLGPGVTDGPDVEQLEANLVALGIVTSSELTVDQHWTDATTNAVEEWQGSLGLDDTGVLEPGSFVFMPGPVRVAEHPSPVGSPASGESVLGLTGSTHLVTIDLEATRQSLVQPGQAVDVVLPDGTETTGTIYSVGDVATSDDSDDGDDPAGGGGDGGGDDDTEPTIEVVVALDDPAAGGTLDQAPVTVRLVTSAAADVLAVPVEALLALAEGGYAVEMVHDDGTTSLVAVELGAFADGWVEVTGNVSEGAEVVIPGE